MITVYSYNPTTFLYIGETFALPNPLEPSWYLIPRHATTTQPPAVSEGSVAVYLPGYDTWSVHVDKRGIYYDVYTQATHVVNEYNATIPATWTSVAPPPESEGWQFDGSAWVRTLATAKNEKIQEIDNAYAAASQAYTLYNTHNYVTSLETIRILITQLAILNAGGGAGMISITDADSNVWSVNKNTLESIVDNVGNAINAVYINYVTKRVAIEDASTIPDVDAITW